MLALEREAAKADLKMRQGHLIASQLNVRLSSFSESLLVHKEYNEERIKSFLDKFKQLVKLDPESIQSINKQLADLYRDLDIIEKQFKKTKYQYINMDDNLKEYIIKVLQGFKKKLVDLPGFDVHGVLDETWQGPVNFFNATTNSRKTTAEYKIPAFPLLEEIDTETVKLRNKVASYGSKVCESENLSVIDGALNNLQLLVARINSAEGYETQLEKVKEKIQFTEDLIKNQSSRLEHSTELRETVFNKFENLITSLSVKLKPNEGCVIA